MLINNRLYIFSFLTLLILGFFSCDKVSVSKEKIISETIDTTKNIRKILVEEYTGQTCGNCPRAAETLETLRSLYHEKIVTIGVHVGTFAKPCPSLTCPPDAPVGAFKSDYRTTAGNDYNTTFGNDLAGLPNGMVNRMTVNGARTIPYGDWGSKIQGLINAAPDANIKITNTYNQGTKLLNTKLETKFLNSLTGTYKLVVLLTEDSIIDWQHDYQANPQNISNYIHRHVLKGAINSTWGDAIASTAGLTVTNNYTYTLSTLSNASKCYVVAFIYDDATKEVIQAEEKKLIQ